MNWIKLLPLIVTAVDTVETLIKDKGKAKQDKAVDLVKVFVLAAEGIAGKDLLDDPAVDAAMRQTIDAIVAFQNIVIETRARLSQG